MTTSGTTTFNYNRDSIIRAALRKLQAIASGETPDSQTVTDCADQLNAMVKAWEAIGIHIWTETEAILFPVVGQAAYTLGVGSGDHVSQIYNQTYLSSSLLLGATSSVVNSNTGAVVGGSIGITLDDGTIFWGTISSISSTTINFPTTPTTDSATSGGNVYFTSTNIDRPLRVVAARRWNSISNIETPLIALSRNDYRNLPNKTAQGMVTQFFYDPRGGANNSGVMYLWPTPVDTTNNQIKFTYYRMLQDFNSAADTPDFPQEWIDCMIWNLAKKMAPEFDCTPPRYQMIVTEAASSLDLVTGWDREPESTYFGVNFDQR